MWLYGRGNSGGSWLPEEKNANMWHGRGNSGGSWPTAFPPLFLQATFVEKPQFKKISFQNYKLLYLLYSDPPLTSDKAFKGICVYQALSFCIKVLLDN